MEKNLEIQLNELMMKNNKKFVELIEKATHNFREKYNKEIYIKNKESLRILDGSSPSDFFASLEIVEDWIEKCIDDIRNYIKPVSYPLFVYLYLELILRDYWSEGRKIILKNLAKEFFQNFSQKYTAFHEELEQLGNLKEPLNISSPIVSNYLRNKIHIYIPRTIFDFFFHFLNTNNLILIIDILNKYFERSSKLFKN
jgi:DNA repair exonuclease SbcCD ATPase subunit